MNSHLLNIGCANPQRVLGLHGEVKHGGVVGGVGDEGGWHNKSVIIS